jgi:Rrf2 family protein
MAIKLNRQTDYALVATAHLAEAGAVDDASAVSASAIARRFEMPRSLVMKLLKQLHEAGLVGSTRGASGGYYLAWPPRRISVAQVVEAVEGPMRFSLCCSDDEDEPCQTCATPGGCPIADAIRQLGDEVHAMLRSVSVEDLVQGRVLQATRTSRSASPLAVLTVARDTGTK